MPQSLIDFLVGHPGRYVIRRDTDGQPAPIAVEIATTARGVALAFRDPESKLPPVDVELLRAADKA